MTKESQSSLPVEAPYWDPERITQIVQEIGGTVEKYSVDPETVRNIKIPQDLKITDEAVARILSRVGFLDENLKKPEVTTDGGVIDAAIQAYAKANAVAEYLPEAGLKSIFRRFADKAADTAVNAIAFAGRKPLVKLSLGLFLLEVACAPEVGNVPGVLLPVPGGNRSNDIPLTVTVIATSTKEPTPTATEIPDQPGEPDKVNSIEQVTGMDMIKSPNGEYYVFRGDKEERYKLPVKDSEFDTFVWTIGGKDVTFQNLTQDIVNKGVDANGNKESWIQGFSATKDKSTGEIKWDLVAVDINDINGDYISKLPEASRYSNKADDEQAIDNILNYLAAVNEKYPVKDLFPTDLKSATPKEFVIDSGHKSASGRMSVTMFYPVSNVAGSPLMLLNANNILSKDGDPTGDESPIQFERKGAMRVKMPKDANGNEWATIMRPVVVLKSDGTFITLQTYEDEVCLDHNVPCSLSDYYKKYYQGYNGIIPALLEDKSMITSLTESTRLANWIKSELKESKAFRDISSLPKHPSTYPEWKGKYVIKDLPDFFSRLPWNAYLSNLH